MSLNTQIIEGSLESFAIRIAEQDRIISHLLTRVERLESQVVGHLIKSGEY